VIARAVTVAALVLLGALGAVLPPWAFVAATAALLLALVSFEMWAYRRAQLAAA
jgi:hypothetical protein